MKYDHIPRPEIEQHYHIRELIEAQERRHEDRKRAQQVTKDREERDTLIADSKPFDVKDFYCDTCKQDFVSTATKQIEEDWNASQRISFYKAKCWKGHWCIRLVTDRHRDAFFYKSKLVALDRGNHFADLVQPFETGYNMLYGKK